MRVATVLTTAGIALLGTMAFAQNITYDFDKTANFSKFRSYAWVQGTTLKDELIHKRVVSALDRQLASKGLSLVETDGSPDVLVAYHASFERNLEINGFSSGWGPYRFGGSRSGTARAQEILVGTLVVDMVDAASKTIVWRGIASTDIDVKASPQKRDRNINRAAEKLFRNYPPRGTER